MMVLSLLASGSAFGEPDKTGLEVRDFVFSREKNGVAVTPPVFNIGEKMFIRFAIGGISFEGNAYDLTMTFKGLGADGSQIGKESSPIPMHKEVANHPDTWSLPVKMSVVIGTDLPPGVFTYVFTITDNIAKTSVTYKAKLTLQKKA